MDRLYKRSKFQLNRMKNSRVIRGQSFRHSLPTLECKFEPNVTFTDRDETGARRKVWINDSPGPSAQKFLSPIFRVMAPYNWYLLMFGTDMYLPMTYKLYKMRACLLRTYGVIKVFTFSRPKFHRVQCKLEDLFQQDALPRVPWLPFTFVDINDLRMRINLQHRRCLPLAAIGVKMIIYWIFGAP